MTDSAIKLKITRYSADAGRTQPYRVFRQLLADLPAAHELGYRLAIRNIKTMYRQSLLGFFWAVVPSLITAVLWIFLRNQVLEMEDTAIPYPVFVLSGTLLWQVFTEAAMAPLNAVNSNRAMLTKININKEGLLLAGLYNVLFNLLVKLLLIVIVFIVYGQAWTTGMWKFPIGLAMLVLSGFAVGLWLLPVGMLFSDVQRAWGLFMPFLMYLTPVVYVKPKDGLMAALMTWNPIASILTETRNWLTGINTDDAGKFLVISCGFLLLFLLGLVIYRITIPIITERIGS